jgi:hypothetical protein
MHNQCSNQQVDVDSDVRIVHLQNCKCTAIFGDPPSVRFRNVSHFRPGYVSDFDPIAIFEVLENFRTAYSGLSKVT